MANLSGIVKKISDLVTGTPADDDCFIFGKSDVKKITLSKLKDALGMTSIKDNLNQNRIELTNSSYYPVTVCYRSGQTVYMKCAGTLEKEVPAEAGYVVGVESMMPEEYRPNVDITAYPIVSFAGKNIKIEIKATGRVIFTSPEKMPAGYGLNMHFTYMTGKSNF